MWHIEKNICLNLNTYSQTIISLAFHPQGYFIAVACGMSIQLWDWQNSTGEIEGDFPIVLSQDPFSNRAAASSINPTTAGTNGNNDASVAQNTASYPTNLTTNSHEQPTEEEFPINWRGITHLRNIRAVLFHPSGEYIFAVAPDSPKPGVEELAHCK